MHCHSGVIQSLTAGHVRRGAVEDDEGVATTHGAGVAVDGGEGEDLDLGLLALLEAWRLG